MKKATTFSPGSATPHLKVIHNHTHVEKQVLISLSMNKNLTNQDRILRIVAFLALGVGAFLSKGVMAIILGILSLVMLVTAAIGFCPIYKALGRTGK